MFATFADFLLGAALSRRYTGETCHMRSPSRPRGDQARNGHLAWMARVGTW
jgi:hypothetical protein